VTRCLSAAISVSTTGFVGGGAPSVAGGRAVLIEGAGAFGVLFRAVGAGAGAGAGAGGLSGEVGGEAPSPDMAAPSDLGMDPELTSAPSASDTSVALGG